MNASDLPDLPALLADFAAAAVRTQELFDRAWLDEIRRWRAATEGLAPGAAALLAPLAPARTVVRRHEVEAEVRLRVERRVEFSLGIRVVGAAAKRLAEQAAPPVELPRWSRHRASAQTVGSRLRVTVIFIPPPPPST
ncbi:MAG: hypothetical protein ACKVYV_04015 [Limisphaerales bacterium]